MLLRIREGLGVYTEDCKYGGLGKSERFRRSGKEVDSVDSLEKKYGDEAAKEDQCMGSM